MTQPNLLERARAGNAHAIAALMNQKLQPKGITAKTALKDGCLQVMVQATQVPEQQALVAFIRRGIKRLGAESIKTVKVYGRRVGEEFPDWYQEFKLGAQTMLTSPSASSLITRFLQQFQLLASSCNLAPTIATVAQPNLKDKAIENYLPPLDNKNQAIFDAQEVKLEKETNNSSSESVTLQFKQPGKNSARATLEEFLKIQATLEIGVSYHDLPAVLAPAKFAVQEFEQSKNSSAYFYLSKFIGQIMLYYQIYEECLRKKEQPFAYPSIEGIGIITKSDLGQLIKQEIPEVPEKYVSRGSYCYEFDNILQTIMNKNSEYLEMLEELV